MIKKCISFKNVTANSTNWIFPTVIPNSATGCFSLSFVTYSQKINVEHFNCDLDHLFLDKDLLMCSIQDMINTSSSIFEQNINCDGNIRRRSLAPDLIQKVVSFIGEYKSNAIDAQQILTLEFISGVLEGTKKEILLTWFPKYRCALIAKLNQGCFQEPMRNLILLGLSNHELRVQHKWSHGTEQTVQSMNFNVCTIEPVAAKDFSKFMKVFEETFSFIYEQDRRQKLGRHKKMSPAFIQLVLEETHRRFLREEDDIGRPLKGGWSDVLHHNGGEWPLLNAVIEHLVLCTPYEYTSDFSLQHQHFLCHLQMSILVTTKNQFLSFIKNPKTNYSEAVDCVNVLMTMMTSIARKAADHLSGIYAIEDIEKLLLESRTEIDRHITQRWTKHAETYKISNLVDFSVHDWSINVPQESRNIANLQRDQIRQLSRSNIDLIPVTGSSNLAEVLRYVETLEKYSLMNSSTVLNLFLTTIEQFLCGESRHLRDSHYRVDISSVEKLINKYRLRNRKLLKIFVDSTTGDVKPGLVVELLSKEMLVMWIGFALVHKTLKQQIPMLGNYGVPFNWKSVSHMVLSSKIAQEASLEVSAYIKRNSKRNSKLFDLSGNQETTFQFAFHYASQSHALKEVWDSEKEAADGRERNQWQIIQNKKIEIPLLEFKLKAQKKEKQDLESREKSCSVFSFLELNELRQKINMKNSEIFATENSLKEAMTPPDPVFQPLPREKNLALKILFFLHMPIEMKILSRMTISAQQILCPVEEFCKHSALILDKITSMDKHMEIDAGSWTSWVDYYNINSPTKKSVDHILHPYSEYAPAKPNHVGPNNVKEFYSSTQCVWHPDSLQPLILWNGGGFQLDMRIEFFNPFSQIGKTSIIEYFTEKVDKYVQFALTQYNEHTPATRSNQAIANQKFKPNCFTKSEWFNFSSLRAYPNQQLRRLCSILNGRSLPLTEAIVHTLLRQTLYHLGEVEDREHEIFPLWKTDLYYEEFLRIICEELTNLRDEVVLKPSQQRSMLMLIEITRFFAQWSDRCALLLRNFLKPIEQWIDDCDAQINRTLSDDLPDSFGIIKTLRAKKAIFYHYAIFCYTKGKLTNDDTTKLLKFLVHAKNESKFKDDTSYNEELRALVHLHEKVMTELSARLVAQVMKDPRKKMLTESIREIVSHPLENMTWKNIPYHDGFNSCCFEASDLSQNLYSINILNGIVLCNGTPPSQLPSTILDHPLYKRSFKDRNFETCSSGNSLRTMRPSHEFYYSFRLDSLDDSMLTVTEEDPKNDSELVLLDSCCLPNEGSWGYDLPIILRENYSHWYCRKNKVVLFRGLNFFDRDADFILRLTGNQWHCYRIPSHSRKEIWQKYLQGEIALQRSFDQLIKLRSPLMEVLEKFENRKYIHCYKSPNEKIEQIGKIRYHYPRFDLEFFFDPSSASNAQTKFHSRDYTGYQLSSEQQFSDTLLGFQQYLVLEHNERGKDDTKVIIPHGNVVRDCEGVTVQTEDSSESKLKVYTYDLHPRFGCLAATSIQARIHLADLYAACSTLVPEGRMKMCGTEVGMQLVRRSWTNQPLQPEDYAKLKNMCKHTCFTPGLDLISFEVASSSLQTDFLHTQIQKLEIENVTFPAEAGTEYLNEAKPVNVRQSLTSDEETRVLGQNRCEKATSNFTGQKCQSEKCMSKNIQQQKDEIVYFENILSYMIEKNAKQEPNFIHFSNNNSDVNSNLHKHMLQKLDESQSAYSKMNTMELRADPRITFNFLMEQIVSERQKIELSVFESLTSVPDCCGKYAKNFRLLRCVNVYPTINLEDLVRCAIDRNWMVQFNPFLSQESSEVVFVNILTWMKYCVLEDKLARLNQLSALSDPICPEGFTNLSSKLQIVQELAVYRSWSAREHPYWLAFEVIARLQIRPIQYIVAHSLIQKTESDSEGPITQLNMGEGKTRVILPMLALYWKNSDKLVRFNFLPALLQEAGEYLHNVLTASVINTRVFHFPFNRDVNLTPKTTSTFAFSSQYCYETRGVIICTPEYRQSLNLKWFELNMPKLKNKKDDSRAKMGKDEISIGAANLGCRGTRSVENVSNEVPSPSVETSMELENNISQPSFENVDSTNTNDEICENLIKIDSLNYLDILDEVDEILRTKNKLIYAVGSQEHLPSKESRLNVLQGLLRMVCSSREVRSILTRPLIIQGEVGESHGRFKEFRIIPGVAFQKIEKLFIVTLVKELMNDPPFELRWMKQLRLNKNEVVAYVTKPEVTTLSWERIDPSCHDDVLALRGFLAGGIFVHCLMKRNRVDYGVRRNPAARKKLMAVPFRACETPSLRSEFGHPDCATMFTCLSYYYDGLNSEQVQEAFRTLLLLGDSAQASLYGDWFKVYQRIPHEMKSEHQILLNNVTKIDLSNTITIELLVQYFSRNMKTINFWLHNCVFPVETMQFPYRLEATAWDIASNSANQVAGFSGTNDDRLIMPSSIKWIEQTDLSLIGTDGKMLHLLQKAHVECIRIPSSKPQWKFVLKAVAARAGKDRTHCTCALIDAGALMAGATDNEEVATYLASELDKGVVYFDMAKNGWWVRDKLGRSWPKHSSPIHERDGFVYFDESRTRGADMKLNINSCAVLTLGPQMCKDKLMQAAGRMRMLEHGQILHLIASQDVASKIKSSNGLNDLHVLTPIHVLRWVMINSVSNVARWLPEWAIQGGKFFLKGKFPNSVLIPDMTSLKDMYGNELQEQPVCEVWEKKRENLLKRRIDHNPWERKIKKPKVIKRNIIGEKRKAFLRNKQEIVSDTCASLDEKDLREIDNRIFHYGKEHFTKLGTNLEEECERELEKEVELEQEVEREICTQKPRAELSWDVNQLLYCVTPRSLKNVIKIQSLRSFVNANIFLKGKPLKDYHRGIFNWPPNILGTINFFHAVESTDLQNVSSVNDYLRLVDFFLVFQNGDVLLLSEKEADNVLKLVWTHECRNFVMMHLTYARKRRADNQIKFQVPSHPVGRFHVSNTVLAALSFFQGHVMYPDSEHRRAIEEIVSSDFAKEVGILFCKMRGLEYSYPRSDLHTICTRYHVD